MMRLFLIFVLTFAGMVQAQTKLDSVLASFLKKKTTNAYIEAGTFISSSPNLPFWLRANQYGIVPNSSPLGTVRGAVYQEYDSTHKKFDWGWGLNVVGNVGKESKILLPEGYAKVRYGWFDFYAGRKREIVGLVDSTLSSGSYIWSGNALPLPKVQISWEDYKPLLKNGLIALKGSYAHGWFGEQTYVKNYYLHQKTLYGRLGKPNWKVKFYGGFNHQVQWGGGFKEGVTFDNSQSKTGKFPSDVFAYVSAVTGKSINSLRVKSVIDTSKFAFYDWGNRVGNHLGTIDLGLDIQLAQANVFFYRQNIYEDGSLYYLANIEDGLNGIRIKPKKSAYIKQITVEFLNTSDQGRSNNSNNPTDSDSYFQHGQFQDDWTYQQKVIGTPFMLYSAENPNTAGNFLKDVKPSFFNTRLKAYYLGLMGNYKGIDLISKLSYSYNLGGYAIKPKVRQFSGLLSASAKLSSQNYLNVQTAFDFGKLFKNQIAVQAHFKRVF